MKGVLIGCSVIGIILLSAVGVGIWFFLFRAQPLADVNLSIPSSAEIDHPIEMIVTTSNPHAESVVVDSIDIGDSFLEGFQITNVDPAANNTTDVPFVDQRSWVFTHTLAPGETKSFTFTLNPVIIGHHSGDVDVCNPNQDFKTLLADVVIRATTGKTNSNGSGSGESEPTPPSGEVPSTTKTQPDSEPVPDSEGNPQKKP